MCLWSCNSNEKEVETRVEDSSLELQTVNVNELNFNPSKGLVYYNDKPFTVISERFYDNTVQASKTTYTNGIKNGVERKWFKDGSLSYDAFYSEGLKKGESKTWWKNGNLRTTSRFENGVANGLQEQWYQSGSKFKEITLVNGKEEGLQKAWRDNGKIYNNYEAKNGRIFGLKRATLCFQLEDEDPILADR